MTGEDDAFDECRPSSSQETISEKEKHEAVRLIKQHPLFPVLEILLTKCDRAIWNLTSDDGTADLEETGFGK
ncbi:hypothetical protein L596_003861 [Steinernema carpocapsae]|uniref:Uncharacterized protein n=1 Tax=Steinernema carpocapsae TaxID=34508 RepID=A0A4U8UTZ2_STECR|nr:hypothetical protein L596_003861 [Steinernema carpocapsae]